MSEEIKPFVVVVSGLNGTGKTTLANRLRKHVGAIDSMLINEAIQERQSVVVEGVFADDLRDELVTRATEANAHVVVVECECADDSLRRQRIEERWHRGASPVTWPMAAANNLLYRAHPAPDYRADARQPVETHIAAISALLGKRS